MPKREGTGYLVRSAANHWDLWDRRAWTGAREIEGGIARVEGYVVSVGRGLSFG